jgi:RNA polymerase sigma factor (sigma-70 family)
MASTQAVVVLRHIRGLVASRESADEPDGQLLERFTRLREEAAFHTLVRRHGPLVMGVCRRVLRNRDDADDAFQATFLVLARKAASISSRTSVGSWLYKVAFRMAARARKQTATRQKRESQAPAPTATDPLAEVTGRELLTLLDEELQNLPDRYRAPLVHCYLEGQTRDEAAKQLGCSESTVNRRLEQGKKQLHKRLLRRGVDLSASLIALALTQNVAKAALSKSFIGATVNACLAAAVRGAIGSLVSPRVAALANGALRAMNATKLKIATCLLLAVSLSLTGAGAVARSLANQTDVASTSAAQDKDKPERLSEKQSTIAVADAKDGERMTVRGRVLNPDGKPLAGAGRCYRGCARVSAHDQFECQAYGAWRGPDRRSGQLRG